MGRNNHDDSLFTFFFGPHGWVVVSVGLVCLTVYLVVRMLWG